MTSEPYIFLSYSHDDAPEFVERLCESLQRRGYRVFFDRETIPGGAEWQRSIEAAIASATDLISVLTERSVGSRWFQREWELAQQYNVRIIPLLYRNCNIEGFLGLIQYIDFRDFENYQASFSRLLQVLATPSASFQLESSPISPVSISPTQRISSIGAHHSRNTIFCIPLDTSLGKAHMTIEQQRYRFRNLLVTDTGKVGGRLLGTVGLRNILKKMNQNPALGRLTVADPEVIDRFAPRDAPEPTFAYLYEDEPLEAALPVFLRKLSKAAAAGHYFHMSALPVVDRDYNAVASGHQDHANSSQNDDQELTLLKQVDFHRNLQ